MEGTPQFILERAALAEATLREIADRGDEGAAELAREALGAMYPDPDAVADPRVLIRDGELEVKNALGWLGLEGGAPDDKPARRGG